uniref:Uncharacterized protein n=1 Tax=Siphoviridae sp. ctKwY15 TaxID=2827843 RepID=A0A8S5SU08_9CAUD|nr:MAG TPA: hypothetical protein [Siphoviridae sp. ctKwY15]
MLTYVHNEVVVDTVKDWLHPHLICEVVTCLITPVAYEVIIIGSVSNTRQWVDSLQCLGSLRHSNLISAHSYDTVVWDKILGIAARQLNVLVFINLNCWQEDRAQVDIHLVNRNHRYGWIHLKSAKIELEGILYLSCLTHLIEGVLRHTQAQNLATSLLSQVLQLLNILEWGSVCLAPLCGSCLDGLNVKLEGVRHISLGVIGARYGLSTLVKTLEVQHIHTLVRGDGRKLKWFECVGQELIILSVERCLRIVATTLDIIILALKQVQLVEVVIIKLPLITNSSDRTRQLTEVWHSMYWTFCVLCDNRTDHSSSILGDICAISLCSTIFNWLHFSLPQCLESGSLHVLINVSLQGFWLLQLLQNTIHNLFLHFKGLLNLEKRNTIGVQTNLDVCVDRIR